MCVMTIYLVYLNISGASNLVALGYLRERESSASLSSPHPLFTFLWKVTYASSVTPRRCVSEAYAIFPAFRSKGKAIKSGIYGEQKVQETARYSRASAFLAKNKCVPSRSRSRHSTLFPLLRNAFCLPLNVRVKRWRIACPEYRIIAR